MILITGAGGMLGKYIKEQFEDSKVVTLGLKKDNDIVCNLLSEIPDLGGLSPETVIHCGGSENETDALLNYEGTIHLCQSLDNHPPANFVYISSYQVYGEDAGENVSEDNRLYATSEVGKNKARAEEWLREWALKNDVTLTIIRPARMFGEGVSGESLQWFNDAVGGGYIHIRGNDARLSLVTALDVARGIKILYDRGGVYNISDGCNPRFIDMMEAMTANSGGKKRLTHLPASWAAWVWRLLRFIPVIDRHLNPAVVEKRMKTLTLDSSHFFDRTGINCFDTIAVIERSDADYPYKS